MNAPARLFLTRRLWRGALFAASCAGAGFVLTGCVGNPLKEAAVDPQSPIAAEVAKAARANTDYPSFSEIPAAPTDVRPLRAYGQAARELEVARAQLESATAPETWSLKNTESFASRARTQAGPEISPPSAGQSEAFANSLRQRATPPPPPKR